MIKGIQRRSFSSLLFAQRCEKAGQGGHLQFKYTDHPIDFTFSTFWNDFSHYTAYSKGEEENIENEFRVQRLIKINGEDNLIFEDKEKYVNLQNDDVASVEESDRVERLTVRDPRIAQVQAWIPEDFNVDVHVTGNISGINMKDTKLISTKCSLITDGRGAGVSARRLRNDECTINTVGGNIHIGSYIETGKLDIKTQGGSVIVEKKIGIGKFGLIETGGSSIKVSSVFSMMAHLPELSKSQHCNIDEIKNSGQGLHINSGNVDIDNLQGVVSIESLDVNRQIKIGVIETASLYICSPQSTLIIGHLRSLHSNSYIECNELDLTLSDDFEGVRLFNLNTAEYIDIFGSSDDDKSTWPTLFLKCKQIPKFQVTTRFEILRKKLMGKVSSRSGENRKVSARSAR